MSILENGKPGEWTMDVEPSLRPSWTKTKQTIKDIYDGENRFRNPNVRSLWIRNNSMFREC